MINLIITPKGKAKNVSNMGWLIRHGADVVTLTFMKLDKKDPNNVLGADGLILATMQNGTKFICLWASLGVFTGWMSRNRTMKHLKTCYNGSDRIIYQ